MYSVFRVGLTLFAAVAIVFAHLTAASAASFEFTITAKTGFDKMVAAADAKTAAALTRQYAELQKLRQQDAGYEMSVNSLHYKNKETESAIRHKMKDIGKQQIAALETETQRAKNNYAPLFALYDVQKKQLSRAKAAKHKSLADTLNRQLAVTKTAVDLAKGDIKAKEAAVKKAKTDAANKVKEVRSILSGKDAPSIKIKSAKSDIRTTNKLFAAEIKVANQSARKGDAAATASSLSRLDRHQKQLIAYKSKQLDYERQIETVLTKAANKVNAYLP